MGVTGAGVGFLSLGFENFLSFRARQEVPLAGLGLVLVCGQNRVSEAADSNGAGKSSIFSALSWCLFGETLPGPDGKVLRADEVACRFTRDPCVVELVAGTWAARRGQRPAGVALRDPDGAWWTTAGWASGQERGAEIVDGRALQAKIEQLVGFGPATFRNAVVFGQGTFERFAQADQAAQMRMLDEIQGLDFRAALDRAKTWRDAWRRKLDALAGEAAVLASRREGAARARDELRSAQARFHDGKEARIEEAERRLSRMKAAAVEASGRAAVLAQEAAGAKAKAERWVQIQELERCAQDEERALGQERERVARARDVAGERDKAVDRLISGKQCPTCRRAIAGEADVAKVRRAFAPDLKAAQEALAGAEERAAAREVAWKAAVVALERRRGASPGLTLDAVAAAQAAERMLLEARRAKAERDAEYRAAVDAVKAERAAKWDGEAALAAAGKEIGDAEDGLRRNGDEQVKARRTVAAAEYWVEAFGDRGLRSLLFDSVAGFLNGRVADHLAVLTAGEAQIEVSALTALKSGAMKERLSIGASWTWGAGSYAAGSAGQDRRIDLALFAALQDLAESRSARPFPLKIWDEAADSLDGRGKEVFARWVRQQSLARGTGFLVTHDADFAATVEADRVWTVVLDKNGSRVEVGS